MAGTSSRAFSRRRAWWRRWRSPPRASSRRFLEEGELSVGVTVDITHSAATPPGATVTATATLLRVEGKLFVFEVSATDDGGEIGRGTHKRAVVLTSRLVEGAARRRRM